jgi:hypothetical protein
MNYGLGEPSRFLLEVRVSDRCSRIALSLKLEKYLAELESQGLSSEEDIGESLEDRAMSMAADEIFKESGDRWKPWACNGKALRVGEIILIVDSDTIVPEVRPFLSS